MMEIAFPVTIPALFDIQYVFTVPEEDAKKLGLNGIENLLSLNIINMPQGKPQESTVNLLAPLVINMTNRKAIQMILPNEEYSVREKLFKDENFNFGQFLFDFFNKHRINLFKFRSCNTVFVMNFVPHIVDADKN